MLRIPRRNHYIKPICQIFMLLGLTILAWQAIHRPQEVEPNIYPYLTSLSPNLVIACQEEGLAISPDAWLDLLAIRSTIPDQESQNLIRQIYSQKPFKHLDWGGMDPALVATVQRHREILLEYPYFRPGQYVFPISGETWYTDTFGAERSGGERKHEGTDLFGQEGTPIVSIATGYVEKLGWNRLGGERVGVRGDDGNYYYYAHLQQIAPSLYIGKRVGKGDAIGSMGHTGDAIGTPDHLHFGIELPDGTWINPYPFLIIWQKYGVD